MSGIRQPLELQEGKARVQVGHIGGGVACDDALEVLRVALCLH